MTKTKRVYSKKDFNSGDGMLTSVWGPSMWHYLHIMSFNYPVKPTSEEKKHYRDFVLNMKHVLPCKYCRINLKTNFKQIIFGSQYSVLDLQPNPSEISLWLSGVVEGKHSNLDPKLSHWAV